MTKAEMNRACAEWLGYTELQMQHAPDFCSDRNALPELVCELPLELEQAYLTGLSDWTYTYTPDDTEYDARTVCFITALPMSCHVEAILKAVRRWVVPSWEK